MTHLAAALRGRGRLLALAAALGAGGALALRAEPQAGGDPLKDLNVAFRKSYALARVDELAKAGPVILADGEALTLVRGKRRDRVEVDLAVYHDLKAVTHAPLAIYVV